MADIGIGYIAPIELFVATVRDIPIHPRLSAKIVGIGIIQEDLVDTMATARDAIHPRPTARNKGVGYVFGPKRA